MSTSANAYDLSKSPSQLLHRAGQIAATMTMAPLKAAGLTHRQFALLCVLSETDGVSQSVLVNLTGIDRSTLAEMAVRMEQDGYIKRRTSKHDARAKSVTIMAKGRKAVAKATPGMKAADAAMLDLLPASRQSTLTTGLAKFVIASEEPAAPARTRRAAPKPAKKKAAAPKKKAAKPAAKKKSSRKKKR